MLPPSTRVAVPTTTSCQSSPALRFHCDRAPPAAAGGPGRPAAARVFEPTTAVACNRLTYSSSCSSGVALSRPPPLRS
eukprot:1852524-Pyramimonas_sp.AAC.1